LLSPNKALVIEENHPAGNKNPLAFLGLTIALSIPFWIFGARPLPLPVRLPVSALQAVTPITAALLLTWRREGLAGVRDLLRRAVDFHRTRNKAWYLPILVLNPAVMVLSYLVMRWGHLPLPEQPVIRWSAAPGALAAFLVFAAAEELGWMGYAFDPLENRQGALKASLILGATWALIHLLPDLQNGQAPGWILWHRLGSVELRVLITWFYKNNGRSVFASILFHAMNNLSWVMFPNYGSHYNPFVTSMVTLPAIVFVLFARGTGYFNRFWMAKPPKTG
jgi:membrane protease YdiL (CAAX protease family)